MDEQDRNGRATVEVEIASPEIAIATLRGEHDLDSKADLSDALERGSRHPYLLVDLGECTFVDSAVIGLLVVTCERMWERDRRLELVIPSDAAAIQRVLQMAGLTTFLTIHATRSEALTCMQPGE